MGVNRVETKVGKHVLSIETGKIAKQADGAAIVRYADTVVLVTAVASKQPSPGDFFPLRTDYREMTYAAGKFPGGFWKREGRPTQKEILTSRVMDRPIRPLFPEGYWHELAVVSVVLSADKENDPDMLAMVGASAALTLSPNIPFLGPIGAVRVGRVEGNLIINPTVAERELSDIEMIVAGTDDMVVMIEGVMSEVSEDELVDAIYYGHRAVADITRIQKELADACGIKWRKEVVPTQPNPMLSALEAEFYDKIAAASNTPGGKVKRKTALEAVRDAMMNKYTADDASVKLEASDVYAIFDSLESKAVRDLIIRTGKRADGRTLTQIRAIESEVSVLPRVHGSALFTRGDTQALVTCTLGTVTDEQRIDGLVDEYTKKFMLDYNFPPFSVGESRMMRAPSRREIGHGNLAECAIAKVMPTPDQFPYTVRIVSDIMESNGSSSMASVCGATLCLMDAGVQIARPVAGIAMGLMKEGDKVCILSDIAGEEDHSGDMDLKVAGTQKGVTAIQMDLKVRGITDETLGRAFVQAKEGRLEILREMLKAIEQPREAISRYAPRLLKIKIPPDKIGSVIGQGGKTIRKLQEDTKTAIEIEDDGTVTISSTSADGADKAKSLIEAMTEEPRIGKVYEGTVSSVKEFGCFVEILPGKDGLVHVSELSDSYVRDVSTICKVGDSMLVKIIDVDDQGRIRLSRKAALKDKS